MKIVLIYEHIPEETKIYVFDGVNPGSELRRHLVGANGHYTNIDDNEHTDFLTEYLVGVEPLPISKLPEVHGADIIVHSGFAL